MPLFGGGGSPYYKSGNGAPTFLAPQGTIYTRQDATGLYVSAPTVTPPAIVQSAHGAAHSTGGAATFGVAVTPGNLLLAQVGWNNDQSAFIGSGWTMVQTSNGGNAGLPSVMIIARYAQAGDGTTPPNLWTGGANDFWGWDAVELSGVHGSLGSDIDSKAIAFSNAGASFNTANQSTTTAGELALLFLSGYNGTANFAVPAGWTAQDNWNDGAANFGAMFLGKQTPASGTNVGGATITKPAGVNSNYFASTLILNGTQAANWTQITIP